MNPQKYLNELFLDDTVAAIRTPGRDAKESVKRLRLYLAACGYTRSLGELLEERGIKKSDYEQLLRDYCGDTPGNFE